MDVALRTAFPDSSDEFQEIENISLLRDKANIESQLIDLSHLDKDTTELKAKLNRILISISLNMPVFEFRQGEENNILEQIDKSYENACLTLEKEGYHNYKDYSVYEFKTRINHIVKLNKMKEQRQKGG